MLVVRHIYTIITLIVCMVSISHNARAEECYRASITTPSPFMGNGNEIFKLSDGTFWQDVSYQYLYLCEYYPSVTICPAMGLMILDENQFNINRIVCHDATITTPSPFMGNGNEIFKLNDGTFWQDVSYQYLYLYEYYPSVIICPAMGLMILDENQFEVIKIR